MKERPIIFSTEMVKALLEGRKTQTRRVIKPQPTGSKIFKQQPCIVWNASSGGGVFGDYEGFAKQAASYCPYGQVGDRLWVRETFCHKVDPVTAVVSDSDAWYRASNPEVIKVDGDGAAEVTKSGYQASPWLPSIHMPRWASRITLEITGIRVERLQEITEEDAKAEGFGAEIKDGLIFDNALHAFSWLWDSLNAKRGYPSTSNPWVWAIEFRQEMPTGT